MTCVGHGSDDAVRQEACIGRQELFFRRGENDDFRRGGLFFPFNPFYLTSGSAHGFLHELGKLSGMLLKDVGLGKFLSSMCFSG